MLAEILELEKTAVSIDQAVELALAELGCTRAEAEIVILQSPARRLLGLFGTRPARVRVKLVDRAFVARRIAAKLLEKANLPGTVSVLPARDKVELAIDSPDSSLIIGRHGQTLDGIQSLVWAMTDRVTLERQAISVDVNGYRERRTASLQRLARRLATRARLSGEPATLPALSADERRIVHLAVQDERGIDTRSIGQGSQRRLVLLPKG